MATTVNVQEARAHLSRLLEAVEAGEDVVIARADKPVAHLVAVDTGVGVGRRVPGSLRGRIRIAGDFDETPEAELAAFRGDGGQ